MKSKKSRCVYVVAITILLAGVSLYHYGSRENDASEQKKTSLTLKHTPEDKPSVYILKSAFQLLNQNFDYDLEKTNRIKNIVLELKKQGEINEYNKLERLLVQYEKNSATNSYEQPKLDFVGTWFEVYNLVESEKYEEAIRLSREDPYALTKIAIHMTENGKNTQKARELLGSAFSQIEKGSKNAYYLTSFVVEGYNKLGDFDKSYQIIESSDLDNIRGHYTLPVIEHYVAKQDVDRAFFLVSLSWPEVSQADGLLVIARNYDNSIPLKKEQKDILREMLSNHFSQRQ
ncbi:MAG: hypothetical protein K8I00_08125 [Candidatus Omnitrophica bacterium]|nr:hypothetical protein [Candidatus Omnitrophota bacterium]